MYNDDKGLSLCAIAWTNLIVDLFSFGAAFALPEQELVAVSVSGLGLGNPTVCRLYVGRYRGCFQYRYTVIVVSAM